MDIQGARGSKTFLAYQWLDLAVLCDYIASIWTDVWRFFRPAVRFSWWLIFSVWAFGNFILNSFFNYSAGPVSSSLNGWLVRGWVCLVCSYECVNLYFRTNDAKFKMHSYGFTRSERLQNVPGLPVACLSCTLWLFCINLGRCVAVLPPCCSI